METLLEAGTITVILASGIRLATPYLYAALGEMFSQRSGVLNLGVEGIMLVGAFCSFYVTHYLQTYAGSDPLTLALVPWNLTIGLLTGMLVGGVMGLLMAFISVTMKAEQGISGIGLHLFGWGLSGVLFRMTLGEISTVDGFKPLNVPALSDVPFLGPVLFSHNLLVYGAFILVPLSWVFLFKTPLGLKIRAVGEIPQAADTLGVSVAKTRYFCVTLGGVLAGLAGTYLSIGLNNMFVDNITNGQGFIAVALVYFGRWHPFGILGGSLLFSVINALQQTVQVKGIIIPIPAFRIENAYEIMVMLPYVVTIIALAFTIKGATQPAALTKPYERGEA